MAVLLPPRVEAEYEDQRRQHAAEIADGFYLTEQLRKWNRELKAISPHLQLIKAQENATHPLLKPGYYHILNSPPGVPASLIVWENPDGSFREPDSALFERLRKGDMWSDRSMKEASDREKKAQAAAERERAREKQERIDELHDRIKAEISPGVLIGKGLSS